jgi:phosphatidylglycerol lysyltransferase
MPYLRKYLAGHWLVHIPALLTALMGLVNVFSAATPALTERLAFIESVFPLFVRRGSRLTVVLAGFALLLLAANLWRRKRLAWVITIVVLLISALTHLVKGLDYEEASLAGGLALWLIFLRPHYHARSDPPSVWQGVRVLAGALLFTLAYGVIGFYLLDRHFSVHFGLGAALRQTVVMFTQFYDPGLEPITGFGRYFADSIYLVGFTTLAYAALLLARPVFLRQPASPAERDHARQIVEANGRSALARLTLLDDKSYFFSPGGSVIAFAARGRVALALGDPVGPVGDFSACLQAFQQHCARNDWQPAYYQVLPDHLDEYRTAGYQALCIGHEAVVDLTTFTLAGGENKSVRTTINKLNRLGFRAEIIQPPLSHELLNALRQISDEWLTARKSVEMRFATGWFDDAYLRSGPVIGIRTPEGEIQAFANLLPEYQRSEMTIDLMRHRTQIENGLMDFLFVSLFQWAQAQGFASFSLGLSALSGIGEHSDDPAIERALHYIFEHVDQFYNFKGLHAFKEKYHPRWEPRYLIYPGMANLPALALALAQANAGGRKNRFLNFP